MADNVNWYSSNLPQAAAYNYGTPADRAKLLADQLVLQQGASDTPIYSPWAGLAKMGASALGGYLQGSDIKRVQDQQNAAMQQFARVYGMAPGSAAATTDPNAPNAPNAPTTPTMTPAQIAQMLPNMATSPTGADTTATPTSSPGTGVTMPASVAGDPSQGNWSDAGVPPAAPPPSPDPTQKTAQVSPEDIPARQAIEAAGSNAQGANIPLPADWLPSQTTGAPSLPSMAMGAPPGTGQGATMPQGATGMPNPADVPAPYAAATAGNVPRSTSSIPPGPPLQSPTGQPPPPGQPDAMRPYQFAQPMPADKVQEMLQFVANPYAPPEMRQAIINRLTPQQIQRTDGSIVQVDLVRGTVTPIVGPVHHFVPAGRAGLRGLDEPTGQFVTAGTGQTGAPGQTFRTPDGVDMVYDVDGVPKVLDTPHNKELTATQEQRAKTTQEALFAPFRSFVGDDKTNALENNQQSLNDLRTLQSIANQLKAKGVVTGVGTDEITRAQSFANTIFGKVGWQPFDISAPEGMGKFTKALALAELQAGGGDRATRMTNLALNTTLQSTPGNELSPEGNQRVLGLLTQRYERATGLGHLLQDWAAGGGTDPREMTKIINDYDAAHHPTDPLTGEDLTKVQNNPPGPTSPAPPGQPPGPAPGPPPPPTNVLPRVRAGDDGEADYAALKSGQWFVDPNGGVRRKP